MKKICQKNVLQSTIEVAPDETEISKIATSGLFSRIENFISWSIDSNTAEYSGPT